MWKLSGIGSGSERYFTDGAGKIVGLTGIT